MAITAKDTAGWCAIHRHVNLEEDNNNNDEQQDLFSLESQASYKQRQLKTITNKSKQHGCKATQKPKQPNCNPFKPGSLTGHLQTIKQTGTVLHRQSQECTCYLVTCPGTKRLNC